jgi:hypothetical protein
MTFLPAFTFVLFMGAVNLFGDMTYEDGGSINGQYIDCKRRQGSRARAFLA